MHLSAATRRSASLCAGICPLYWGKGADGSTWFASEMKALQHTCVSFEIFPPVRPYARVYWIESLLEAIIIIHLALFDNRTYIESDH